MSDAVEPEQSREELEEERDFLLKSLDDLDRELTAGNIDPDSYRTLHDDYTARASAIIRTLADGEERETPREPNLPRVMKIVTAMAIVIFCVLIAIAITHSSGQRRPGQTATGNNQVSNTVNANTYEAHIAKARTALNDGNLSTAVQEYSAAAQLDATQAEPLAYRGWISALAARQTSTPNIKSQLEANAAKDLDQAIRVNKKYAPAYVFKGLFLVQEGKQAQAIPDFQTYLTLAPSDDPMRSLVLSALRDAVNATKKP
jgi:cytochrome c-type biogenesis protein CcmH/NrfG